jgi:hypothetical protein
LVFATVLFGLSAFLSGPLRAAFDFPEIDPADLALKEPSVEKDAAAEILLWDISIEDGANPVSTAKGAGKATLFAKRTDLVRMKLFAAEGVGAIEEHLFVHWNSYGGSTRILEKLGLFQGSITVGGGKREGVLLLPAPKGATQRITARVIGPDGVVKDTVEARTGPDFEKSGVRQVRLPPLDPGCILEYHLETERIGAFHRDKRITAPRGIPVRRLTLAIRPLGVAVLKSLAYHVAPLELQKRGPSVYEGKVENMPSRRLEPFSPSGPGSSPGLLLYYDFVEGRENASDIWKIVGQGLWKAQQEEAQGDFDFEKAAAREAATSAPQEERLRGLFSFTLRRFEETGGAPVAGAGNKRVINLFFVALARAAGFDARYGSVADREEDAFNKAHRIPSELSATVAAVRMKDRTAFFDPGSPNVPFGMLRWQLEGQPVLLADANEETWLMAPYAETERSAERRFAEFTLYPDGRLEGEVRVVFTGHRAIERRDLWRKATPEVRSDWIAGEVRRRLPGAEVTGVTITAVDDPEQDLSVKYRIQVPGYASRAGKLLSFKPSFFESGTSPVFPAADRRNPVVFPYGWTSEDRIEIKLPEGFVVEGARNPEPLRIGSLGAYALLAEPSGDGRTLKVSRTYSFSRAFVPQTSYAQIKQAFDLIHETDQAPVTLQER